MKLGFVALREPLEKAGRASLIARVSMASVANARRLRRRSREEILHTPREYKEVEALIKPRVKGVKKSLTPETVISSLMREGAPLLRSRRFVGTCRVV